MGRSSSPTLRRLELGKALRDIRESQGKTIEQVSHDLSEMYRVGFSSAKISRLETAKRGVNPRDVRDLCEYYGVSAAETERLMQLARDSRANEQWQGLDEGYANFVALESIAMRARTYESMFVPGLLQVTEYSRAVESIVLPGDEAGSPDPEHVAARVAQRAERQQRLVSDNPLELHVVIDENALRRTPGPPEIMAAQLRHLIEVSRLSVVIVQVIPISAGMYPGFGSSNFTVLDFSPDEPMASQICYSEGLTGTMIVDKEADLFQINRIYDHMQRTAPSPAESRRIMSGILSELE